MVKTVSQKLTSVLLNNTELLIMDVNMYVLLEYA